MLRKIVSLILAVLMVTMLSASAMASGILPSFEEFAPDPAVSFGVTVGKEPISETTLEDGSIQQRYVLVTDDDYTAFGVRLGDADYTIASQETLDNGIAVVVTNGSQSMEVRYLRGDGEMLITYPAGTEIEQPAPVDLFPGYIRVNFGEEISTSAGKFTFQRFMLNSTIRACSHMFGVYGLSKHYDRVTVHTWIELDYFNSSQRTKEFYSAPYAGQMVTTSEFRAMNPTLYYINADGQYSYTIYCAGKKINTGDGEEIGTRSTQAKIEPLTSNTLGISFNIPEALRTSTDGTIAITFTLDDQNYVLYIRENGVDLI